MNLKFDSYLCKNTMNYGKNKVFDLLKCEMINIRKI